jgi:hypothetical protein
MEKVFPVRQADKAEMDCPTIRLAVTDCPEVQVLADLTVALELIFFYT